MQSTLTPIPAIVAAWAVRLHVDKGADLETAYYAGWFLDLTKGDPSAITRGRKAQQFPCNVESDALGWFHGKGNADPYYKELGWGMDPYTNTVPQVVFAFEHFSRFDAANRVWPPLVWASYDGEHPDFVGSERYPLGAPVLTYRRDYDAPGWNVKRHKGERVRTCIRGCEEAGKLHPHNHYSTV